MKICYLLSIILLYSCTQQKNIPQKINCKVYPDNLSRVSFSDNEKDLLSIELSKFYNENNDFEVIIYNFLEGSYDYELQRFFKTKSGERKQIKIENGRKLESTLGIIDNEILSNLNMIEEKAFFQFCGVCYDCQYYTFLIKKRNIIFKYYSNAVPFDNIDNNENEKMKSYIAIYDFFKGK